jgi:hypothetical protein
MDKKPPSMVQFNYADDEIEESKPDLKLELKDESDDDVQDEELIKIEEKEKMVSNDIFEDIPAVEEPAPAPEPSIKPVKEKKKRKPMSEEHKQKLALAREKAMLVRKQKAEEKKKMKALDNEEKELLKKQRVKKVQKLKEEVEDDYIAPVSKVDKVQSGLTKKDLEEAQLEAIMKYEALRKERKAKKKEEAMIEEGKKKMLNQINRATNNYSYRDGSNRFDRCY